jgi:DNA-directed RNA polymerase subunit L
MPIFKITSHGKLLGDILTFELNHTNRVPIYTSYANGIRRIIMSEIESIMIERDTVNLNNTSMLNNDILSHRLILIPFYNKYLLENDVDKLELSLSVINTNEHMIDVFASDMIIKNTETNTVLDINKTMVYPEILYARLKPSQILNLTASFHRGTTKSVGAQFTVSSCTTYQFKKDINAIHRELRSRSITSKEDIQRFQLSEGDRYFLKDSNDNPLVYEFTIEPIGSIPSINIMIDAFDVISGHLNIIKEAITNQDTNIIQIYKSDGSLDQYVFKLFNYDDTMGNMISEYLYNNNKTNYASYNIPHPLDIVMIIKMSLTTKNTHDENIKVFIEVLDQLLLITNSCKSEFI